METHWFTELVLAGCVIYVFIGGFYILGYSWKEQQNIKDEDNLWYQQKLERRNKNKKK